MNDLPDDGRVWWFGPEPFAPICGLSPVQPTPVGRPCFWCAELFEAGDSGLLVVALLEPAPHTPCSARRGTDEGPYFFAVADTDGNIRRVPWHRECFQRSIVGSAEHQAGRCSCYGFEEKPDTLTKREAALAATEMFLELSRRRC